MNRKAIYTAIHNDIALTVMCNQHYQFWKMLSWIYSKLNMTNGLALLPWRFLLTEGDPGWPGLEVAEVVGGRPEEEVEVGACCWDTFCSSAASCFGSTPGDLGGLSPRGGSHQRHPRDRNHETSSWISKALQLFWGQSNGPTVMQTERRNRPQVMHGWAWEKRES